MSLHCDDDLFEISERSCNSDDETDFKNKEPLNDVEDESGTKTSKQPAAKTKKYSKRLQFKLDPSRVCSHRGIMAVSTNFKNLKLKGKGYEKTDLDVILSKMEHWAHRLFPKLPFDDCIEQVAKLGNNRSVQLYMKNFRNQTSEIEIEHEEDCANNLFDSINNIEENIDTIRNQCSNPVQNLITEEQHNRMAENRRKAEEKRRMKLVLGNTSDLTLTSSASTNENCDLKNISLSTTSGNILEEPSTNTEMLDIDEFLENLP